MKRLRRRWLAAIALAVLAAGGLAFLRSFRPWGGKGVPADYPRDVPHVEDGAIVLSRAYGDRAGIAFTKAEQAPFKRTVRVVGTVTFNPSYQAAAGTRLRGTVRRTLKYDGDRVSANEPLAEIESAELGEAQSAIAEAQAVHAAAEVQARRESDLLDKSLTTAREAEVATTELATATARLRAAEQRVNALGGNGSFGVFVLRSPIAGNVVEVHIAPGQSVDANVVAYRIADLEHLWIELSVFERDLESVQVDDLVEVTALADPRQKIAGRVDHVGEVIDSTTRSAPVRVAVDHPEYHLRVGQAVQATITSGEVERDAVLIPRDAVVYVDGKSTAFVSHGLDGGPTLCVRAVPVRLGGTDGTRFEVLEGLRAGQLVACSGVFALKSELFR